SFLSPRLPVLERSARLGPVRQGRAHCLRRGGICRYDDCSEGEEQIGTCYHHTMICCRDEFAPRPVVPAPAPPSSLAQLHLPASSLGLIQWLS
uniref:Beta-defensin-like domain-containing protein n=1 Tax=Varanus komodoensis TaxID=61221 RepID=A0A8D2J689_VARKO